MPTQSNSGLGPPNPGQVCFDIKAFRLFTNHPTQIMAIPKDIRDLLPHDLKRKSTLYYNDVPRELRTELWRQFEDALLPLDSAGKLGTILFQFPPCSIPEMNSENIFWNARCIYPSTNWPLSSGMGHG